MYCGSTNKTSFELFFFVIFVHQKFGVPVDISFPENTHFRISGEKRNKTNERKLERSLIPAVVAHRTCVQYFWG